MTPVNWQQVLDTDFAVPVDAELADLTADLTRLLADVDPHRRDQVALPVLATWIERGVYDDLLIGLGDGMAAGLRIDPVECEDDSVFRRSFSVLVLAECIARDTQQLLVPSGKVLEWGDRIVTWLLAEQDLRGYVVGKGWAHAVAHGADAIGVLARSPHVGMSELIVLLDVLAERVRRPADRVFASGEPDRLAGATLAVLRRDEVPLDLLETWLSDLVEPPTTSMSPGGSQVDEGPFVRLGNVDAFARALYLQLALAPDPPAVRTDLLLLLVESLRTMNPHYLGTPRAPA